MVKESPTVLEMETRRQSFRLVANCKIEVRTDLRCRIVSLLEIINSWLKTNHDLWKAKLNPELDLKKIIATSKATNSGFNSYAHLSKILR